MKLAFAALLLLVTGCTPAGVLNALVSDATYERHAAMAYGNDPRLKLDVYVPREGHGPHPVVVFFYGGSWQTGNRGDYVFVAEALASRGFVVVVPDYRVWPQGRYPQFMQDAAGAFAWTHREIGRYRGDASHIVVMGHSAGAHIAAMLAYNERFLRGVGLQRSKVKALVGLSGPYDFEPSDARIREILAAEGPASEAMPARFVKGGEPPSLLITGDRDPTVSPGNTERLAKRLRDAGDVVIEQHYPGLNHYMTVARLAAPLRDEELLERIARFARRPGAAREAGAAAR